MKHLILMALLIIPFEAFSQGGRGGQVSRLRKDIRSFQGDVNNRFREHNARLKTLEIDVGQLQKSRNDAIGEARLALSLVRQQSAKVSRNTSDIERNKEDIRENEERIHNSNNRFDVLIAVADDLRTKVLRLEELIEQLSFKPPAAP